MNAQQLKSQWFPYEPLVPFEKVLARIELPISLMGEDCKHLIPSFAVSSDGPVINSLFLISQSLICEVRLRGLAQDFDIAQLVPILNYRVVVGTVEFVFQADGEPKGTSISSPSTQAPASEPTKLVMETAKVKIIQGPAATMHSEFTYVGPSRDAWLKTVVDALPISLLKQANL